MCACCRAADVCTLLSLFTSFTITSYICRRLGLWHKEGSQGKARGGVRLHIAPQVGDDICAKQPSNCSVHGIASHRFPAVLTEAHLLAHAHDLWPVAGRHLVIKLSDAGNSLKQEVLRRQSQAFLCVAPKKASAKQHWNKIVCLCPIHFLLNVADPTVHFKPAHLLLCVFAPPLLSRSQECASIDVAISAVLLGGSLLLSQARSGTSQRSVESASHRQ